MKPRCSAHGRCQAVRALHTARCKRGWLPSRYAPRTMPCAHCQCYNDDRIVTRVWHSSDAGKRSLLGRVWHVRLQLCLRFTALYMRQITCRHRMWRCCCHARAFSVAPGCDRRGTAKRSLGSIGMRFTMRRLTLQRSKCRSGLASQSTSCCRTVCFTKLWCCFLGMPSSCC
jgi:hypothetical protein